TTAAFLAPALTSGGGFASGSSLLVSSSTASSGAPMTVISIVFRVSVSVGGAAEGAEPYSISAAQASSTSLIPWTPDNLGVDHPHRALRRRLDPYRDVNPSAGCQRLRGRWHRTT